MADEHKSHQDANHSESSRVADAFRLIGAAICVCMTLAGLGIFWFGSTCFRDMPTRDRPYFIFVGSVICLIGLLATGFGLRWLVNAIRPKRNAGIHADTPGE